MGYGSGQADGGCVSGVGGDGRPRPKRSRQSWETFGALQHSVKRMAVCVGTCWQQSLLSSCCFMPPIGVRALRLFASTCVVHTLAARLDYSAEGSSSLVLVYLSCSRPDPSRATGLLLLLLYFRLQAARHCGPGTAFSSGVKYGTSTYTK